MPPPEPDLVRQAKHGSREAYESLLAQCEPVIRAFLANQLGSRLKRHTSLSDLHQEVLMRGAEALRALPDDAEVDDFRALLLMHARWAIGKAVRRGRNFAGESVVTPEFGPQATPTPTASQGVVTRGDEMAWLAAEVDGLEAPLAAAVRLRLQGRTFAEIAAELGIGEDAARKRLVRAALLLRERRTGSSGQ